MTFKKSKANGVLVVSAYGDALGAGYEFQNEPLPDETAVFMRGGNGFAPGEWTDDTGQAIALGLAAMEVDLRTEGSEEVVRREYLRWYDTCKDVGVHTRDVFELSKNGMSLREAAARKEAQQPQSSGGNGAIMRTGVVALAYSHLDGEEQVEAVWEAARKQSLLTHKDEPTADLAGAWTLMVLASLKNEEPGDWEGIKATVQGWLTKRSEGGFIELLNEAEGKDAREWGSNGWSRHAVGAAWSAVTSTESTLGALEACCRVANDTDTVACIAGQVLGASRGVEGLKAEDLEKLHGWPGWDVTNLKNLAWYLNAGR